MNIHCIALGPFQTNSYVVRATADSTACLIMDAGFGADELLSYLQAEQLRPQAILLTHGHADHIAGVPLLLDAFPGLALYVFNGEVGMLSDPALNLSAMTGQPFSVQNELTPLQDDETVQQAGMEFRVIHTPGHTPGGICFYCQAAGVLFAGDTLFAESVGRTDFPGGSMTQLQESIKTRLFGLPDETRVYPGHGPETSIGQEKCSNPFVR